MVTEQENKLRNIFFNEKGMKAYEGHINNSDKVIWKEEYVKWLESKLSQTPVSGQSELLIDFAKFIQKHKNNGLDFDCVEREVHAFLNQ